jgi:hypothetical protein
LAVTKRPELSTYHRQHYSITFKTVRKAQLKQKTKLGRNHVFACEVENNLAEYCLLIERKFFGLTMADVMRIGYQPDVRNGMKNQFCNRNEKTERKWLRNFLRRHQEISVTTPENLHSQERRVSLLNQ